MPNEPSSERSLRTLAALTRASSARPLRRHGALAGAHQLAQDALVDREAQHCRLRYPLLYRAAFGPGRSPRLGLPVAHPSGWYREARFGYQTGDPGVGTPGHRDGPSPGMGSPRSPGQDEQLPRRHVEPVRRRGLPGHHGQVPVGVDQQAELALLQARRRRRHSAGRRRRGRASCGRPPACAGPGSLCATSSTLPVGGIPATRASATVAASCKLPKRSTHVTSTRRQLRPSCRRPCSTTPPISRTSESGSISWPSVASGAPAHKRGGGGTEDVTPVEGRAAVGRSGVARQLDGETDGRLRRDLRRGDEQARCPARRSTACGPSPASPAGRCPVAPCRRRDRPRRAPRRCRGAERRARACGSPPARRRAGCHASGRSPWFPVPGAGDHRVDHPDEFVLRAEVGEEEDGPDGRRTRSCLPLPQPLSDAGCASARSPPPPPP